MADSDEFDVDAEDQTPNSGKGLRAKLEAALDELKEAKTQLQEHSDLKNRLALHEAGLGSLKPVQVKALLAAHEGELKPEDLKSTATELGFVKDEKPAEQQEVPSQQNILDLANAEAAEVDEAEQDLAAISRIAGATVSSTPQNPDPNTDLVKRMSEASSQVDLEAILSQAGLLLEQ